MPDEKKPFIRVKDKRTGHQFDIHRDRFNPEIHDRVERVEDSWHARPAKPSVTKKRAPKAEPAAETSTPEVVEGVSPEPVSAS